ncbi:MAG: hypothetical protein GC181_12385 [Bacteroidetes bacterium]|nr:hypothetical protein [Bacteroidota bacterium]
MRHSLKIVFSVCLISLISNSVCANSAQPGIWNAGGTGTFSFLYPNDSMNFQKVQMVDEKVSVQLYSGYAVVKGTYFLVNQSHDTVKIHAGYPVNSFHDFGKSHYLTGIHFDSLSQLRVKVNHLEVKDILKPIDNEKLEQFGKNWYTWVTTFIPGDTTVVEVYFLMNTNDAAVSQGYNRDHINAFLYILETGANWMQPVKRGEVRIQLMDGFTLKNVVGGSPDSIFQWNEQRGILLYRFENLFPTEDNNIVITYGQDDKTFDFSAVVTVADNLFREIENFSGTDLSRLEFKSVTLETPFITRSTNVFMIVFWSVIIGLPLIFFLIIFFGVRYLVRRSRRQREMES